MFASQTKAVSIATNTLGTTLSKGQKAFNKLIKQIEQKRQRLAAWEAAIPRYQKKYTEEMLPLMQTVEDLQERIARQLNDTHGQKGLTRTERRMLSDLIVNLVTGLPTLREDAELKAIYNKHSHSDFDTDQARDKQLAKEMLEEMMGIELDDDIDLDSPENFMRQAHEKLEQQQAQAEAEREAREARRKKSAKQIAREAAQEAAKKDISDTIREVYRKLVSALHPDREPDPAERARKNVLMQKTNRAYESRNLLQLLELQLELEHIDPAPLAQLSEDKLKRYNAILREQGEELDTELLCVEQQFIARFQLQPALFERLRPESILRELDVELIAKRHAARDMKNDLHSFADIKAVKSFLKMMRQEAPGPFDDMPF
jgi:hypothetical protein